MALDESREFPSPTLSFESFWEWLMSHANCILRAGTPETVIYDDEDFHWHFAAENAETLLVQIIKGKRLMGELLVRPEQVAYVLSFDSGHDGEQIFELVTETERSPMAAYFFVMSHAFDDDDDDDGASAGRVH